MTTRGERLGAFLQQRTGGRRGSQKALVAKSGVKRQTLTKWTNPKFDGYPDLETLAQVARALEITTAEIVAAMDGDPSALPLDAATEALIRRVVEQVLDERQGPR